MIPKISIGFLNDDTDAELLVDINRILTAMLGNPAYPTPTPALAVVGTARTEFADSVAALDGGTLATATRDEKRGAVVALMRDLALYAQANCQGDLVRLLASGFPAQSAPQPVGLLAAPSNLRLRRPEVSGTLKGRVDPDLHASSYEWASATTLAPNDWREACTPTTAASGTFTGLTPGTLYVVKCRALGSAGRSDWTVSSPMMCV